MKTWRQDIAVWVSSSGIFQTYLLGRDRPTTHLYSLTRSGQNIHEGQYFFFTVPSINRINRTIM